MHQTPSQDKLVSIITELSFSRSLEDVTETIRQRTRELIGADGVTFVLRDSNCCYYVEEDAIGPLWKGKRFPMSDCISGWVMHNRRPAVIPDVFVDDRIPKDAYAPTFVKSLAMVPVRSEDPIAAIGAYWARIYEASREELKLLQALADSAALALSNADLYQRLQTSLRREEEASRAKDDWISLISHELRTPLTAILGWTKLLRSGKLEGKRAEAALEVIERNARLQTNLICELLDASSIVSGKLQLAEEESVALAPIVRSVVEGAAPEADAKQLALEVRTEEVLIAWADPERLRQVCSNLISNAIKFTPLGGQVSVELTEESRHAELKVRDTGRGISPQLVPHLFQRFRPGDSSTTKSEGGLGLGLSIARHLVSLHGGTISVSSDGVNRGCTFCVRLPLHRS